MCSSQCSIVVAMIVWTNIGNLQSHQVIKSSSHISQPSSSFSFIYLPSSSVSLLWRNSPYPIYIFFTFKTQNFCIISSKYKFFMSAQSFTNTLGIHSSTMKNSTWNWLNQSITSNILNRLFARDNSPTSFHNYANIPDAFCLFQNFRPKSNVPTMFYVKNTSRGNAKYEIIACFQKFQ